MEDAENALGYRTVWISDFHLGTRGCKAEFLLDFLRHTESETLYLIGDVFDCWRLKKAIHWPPAHNTVLQKILRKARKGTRVVYLPGNHDEVMRDYLGLQFGGVTVTDQLVHQTADGKRFLVIHGDQFDIVVMHARWLAGLGSWSYERLVVINQWFNTIRRKLGFTYWSLSAYIKDKVKSANKYQTRFEEALVRAARTAEVDGVICGHIHLPEQREIDGVKYYNDGDWVESCTALVEHFDGRLEIIEWFNFQTESYWSDREPVMQEAAKV